jgi:hypothetical protein
LLDLRTQVHKHLVQLLLRSLAIRCRRPLRVDHVFQLLDARDVFAFLVLGHIGLGKRGL